MRRDRLFSLVLLLAWTVSVVAAAPRSDSAHPLAGQAARSALVEEAERALGAGPFSVMQKTRVPPSGDKHDFLTLAPYWWPDPARPGGLPYVRRDGEVNPDSKRGTDDQAFGQLGAAVASLAAAYRETGDERFASRAALLLRTWFIAPATRMNPHLTYGQGIPGRTDGRGEGIIATRRLVRLVEAARLVERSPAWTPGDRQAFREWCAAYAEWLKTSPNGRQEAAARNNHGTWYDAQLVALLLYVGKDGEARAVLDSASKPRLAAQIAPDGRQPQELTRTRSWSYSVMNLEGWFALAGLARAAGVDLWNHRSPGGSTIRGALDYLVPFADGSRRWEHQQITPLDPASLVPLLREAARAWDAPDYEALAVRLARRNGGIR